MITTIENAKKIIRDMYGNDFSFRFSKTPQMGIRPVWDTREQIAWRKLEPGKLGTVWIGKVMPDYSIDWNCEVCKGHHYRAMGMCPFCGERK